MKKAAQESYDYLQTIGFLSGKVKYKDVKVLHKTIYEYKLNGVNFLLNFSSTEPNQEYLRWTIEKLKPWMLIWVSLERFLEEIVPLLPEEEQIEFLFNLDFFKKHTHNPK